MLSPRERYRFRTSSTAALASRTGARAREDRLAASRKHSTKGTTAHEAKERIGEYLACGSRAALRTANSVLGGPRDPANFLGEAIASAIGRAFYRSRCGVRDEAIVAAPPTYVGSLTGLIIQALSA